MTAADFDVVKLTGSEREITAELRNEPNGLQVTVRYSLAPDKPYGHKTLTITSDAARTLELIDVESAAFADAENPYRARDMMWTDGKFLPALGQPLYTAETATFWGVEFDDGAFDVASISFGIRNVGDPSKGIAEMARVVRPGGRVIVLEFGQPSSRVVGSLYRTYRRHFLPRLGGAVTGERGAYEYLESSAARFPCGDEFVALMRRAAKFSSIDYRPLTFGIAYLYRGVV